MCLKRGASDTHTSFIDRTTVKRARLTENDSTLARSSNSQVKQQAGLPSNAKTHSASESSTLSTSASLSTINLLAPKRAVSFDDKGHHFVPSSPVRSPQTFKLAPRFTLLMRPSPLHFPQGETSSNDETSHQLQLPPRVSADAFSHGDSGVFLTPRLYFLSSDVLSPPSVPEHDRGDDCIVVPFVPTELVLPVLE